MTNDATAAPSEGFIYPDPDRPRPRSRAGARGLRGGVPPTVAVACLLVKAKVAAVADGIVTFEEEFLPHIVLADGSTVYQAARGRLPDRGNAAPPPRADGGVTAMESAARAPQRIQRKRTKGWTMPAGAVYVGRPTKWGNPFVVGDDRGRPLRAHVEGFVTTEDAAVRWFGDMLTCQKRPFPPEAEIVRELRGQDLACWCRPGAPCHADVLLEIANRPRCEEVTP